MKSKLSLSPSPAESVPLDGPKAVRIPASGLDSSSADVPPVERSTKDKLDAVKVVERCAMWLGKMIADGGHLNSVAPNDAVGTLQRAEAFLKQEAVPHAAHLAKIQALTEALESLLPVAIEDLKALRRDFRECDVWDTIRVKEARIEAARAALSLPSA
jgi:hypothetical protein